MYMKNLGRLSMKSMYTNTFFCISAKILSEFWHKRDKVISNQYS